MLAATTSPKNAGHIALPLAARDLYRLPPKNEQNKKKTTTTSTTKHEIVTATTRGRVSGFGKDNAKSVAPPFSSNSPTPTQPMATCSAQRATCNAPRQLPHSCLHAVASIFGKRCAAPIVQVRVGLCCPSTDPVLVPASVPMLVSVHGHGYCHGHCHGHLQLVAAASCNLHICM